MTEGVMKFIEVYIPQIVGVGVGLGNLLAVIAILTGYVISKVQSLITDK